MPNMKNAEKAVRTSIKRKKINSLTEKSTKTAIKKVDKAVLNKDKSLAKDNLKVAIKNLDKAQSKGVITTNFVSRQKSRLTKKVNEME